MTEKERERIFGTLLKATNVALQKCNEIEDGKARGDAFRAVLAGAKFAAEGLAKVAKAELSSLKIGVKYESGKEQEIDILTGEIKEIEK